jgi:hypothetical protein
VRFSNATGRSKGRAVTEPDSDYPFLASVSRDLGGALGTDAVHLDIGGLDIEANANATKLDRLEDSLNLGVIVTDGVCTLTAEVTPGLGAPAVMRSRSICSRRHS